MSRKTILGVLLCAMLLAGTSWAGVSVNVNIGVPLPEVVLSAPPALAVISGSYVYVAPEVSANLLFYQDNWYRPHGGGWYVSASYNGPWKAMASPPPALMQLPPNYHAMPPGYERMPYGQVRDNWRSWERDRYWDRASNRGDDEEEREEHHHKHKHKKHHDDDDDDDDNGRDNGRGRDRDRDRHRHDD